jgi:hypothetical protein
MYARQCRRRLAKHQVFVDPVGDGNGSDVPSYVIKAKSFSYSTVSPWFQVVISSSRIVRMAFYQASTGSRAYSGQHWMRIAIEFIQVPHP